MITSNVPDYGMCPCGGKYNNNLVEVRMTVAGQVVVLPDVPQGLCPRCSGRVYKADMLERIELVMRAAPIDTILSRPAV